MPQVVVVGAGYYGLITAKTYLQVTGAYTRSEKNEYNDENDILIIDSGSEIGGTWARDRLYPNLLSQNSYGHYEFSDLPLAAAVPNTAGGIDEDKFIPGWKINRYLHIWCQKWDLTRRIRLNWKVCKYSGHMRRLLIFIGRRRFSASVQAMVTQHYRTDWRHFHSAYSNLR
jgi:cation diffusion facilitator CzcD-associated flavoprotein CzcO